MDKYYFTLPFPLQLRKTKTINPNIIVMTVDEKVEELKIYFKNKEEAITYVKSEITTLKFYIEDEPSLKNIMQPNIDFYKQVLKKL